MNIYKLETELQYLGNSGVILSHEQCVLLFHSLTCLQNDNHFRQVFFWGQVWGVEKDYYVAYGYEKDALRGRTFFYSVDCINWGIMPRSTPELCTLMLSNPAMFQGDPALVIDLTNQPASVKNEQEGENQPPSDDAPEDMGGAPEDIGGGGGGGGDGGGDAVADLEADLGAGDAGFNDEAIPPVTEDVIGENVQTIKDGELKEENRLAAVVDMINEECMVVPRQALLKRPDDFIIENLQFTGLTYPESEVLNNYFHFRIPLQKWNANLLANPAKNYNYAVDFLDTMDKDIPEGKCWSSQYMMGTSAVLLRNLYWPGSIFFHLLNTPEYGNMYAGWGRREIDYPFMFS